MFDHSRPNFRNGLGMLAKSTAKKKGRENRHPGRIGLAFPVILREICSAGRWKLQKLRNSGKELARSMHSTWRAGLILP
ncbi:hypothetical protein [Rhizobium sp. SL42]|uniref:hypothetical protein n=1 Tax=Rhizobium sp. SL42 TaxID=2806346 RepID=UPI001F1C9B8D|nr:hypothetical protein [Rhizobium sp. SL42]UJW73716.1 hypothetical protein IM739_12510 [Rhizobium sp. SL42]